MFNRTELAVDHQFAAQVILGYVIDLFTAANCENFTRDGILILLNAVKNDPELFDPQVVIAYEMTMKENGFDALRGEEASHG